MPNQIDLTQQVQRILPVANGGTGSATFGGIAAYAVDTGSVNAYAITLSGSPTLSEGTLLAVRIANTNTSASTLSVNGGAAIAIKKQGSTALTAGDLTAGQIAVFIKDNASQWQLVTVPGAGGGTGTVTNTGTLTAGQPIFGNGGVNVIAGTKRGSTTIAQMADSTTNPTAGNLAAFDASGNVKDSGIASTGGGVTAGQVQQEALIYANDTGGPNAYAVSLAPAPTIVAGSVVVFKAANTNVGASTLAVNGGSAVQITKNGNSPLTGGEIVAGQEVQVIYDGAQWQMVSLAAGTALSVVDGTGSPSVAGVTTINLPKNSLTRNSSSGVSLGSVPTSGWTAHNGIVYNDYLTPAVLSYFVANNTAVNWRFLSQSLGGASTYTLIVTLRTGLGIGANSITVGLYLTDGTQLIGFEVLYQAQAQGGGNRVRVERMNSVTSDNSTVAGPTANLFPQLCTLKIVKDSTHRTFYYYVNGAFVQFYQEANTAFLVETDVGVGGVSVEGSVNSIYFVEAEVLSWSLNLLTVDGNEVDYWPNPAARTLVTALGWVQPFAWDSGTAEFVSTFNEDYWQNWARPTAWQWGQPYNFDDAALL